MSESIFAPILLSPEVGLVGQPLVELFLGRKILVEVDCLNLLIESKDAIDFC